MFQSVFIRRLSERRKMQRLRAKKRKVDQLVVEVAEDNFEVSPEDAVSELKVSCYFNLPVTFSLKCLIIEWFNYTSFLVSKDSV